MVLPLPQLSSKFFLVVSATLLFLLSPGVIEAQEGAGISNILATTTVRSRFPDGIRFDISVSAQQRIVNARLRYHVIGERVTRYGRLKFAPTTRLENEFFVRTDTSARYIPPGAEIEYALEITDEDGVLAETQPQRFILIDPRFQWERLDAPGGYIYHHGSERIRAQRALDAAQATLTTMGALMGVTDTGPIRMTMYNDVAEMRVALPTTSEVQERSLITEGVSFGDTGVILVLGTTPRVDGVTSHETVHFLVRHAMGKLSHVVPAWLNEGLAEYGNVDPSSNYDRALNFRLSQGTLLPLTSMTAVPGKPDDVMLMYGAARSVVAYMVNTYGSDPMQKLFEGLRAGVHIDDALSAAYGFDRVGLEDEWRESINAPPLEATPSRLALPTAIPRPKLLPFGVATETPRAQSPQSIDLPVPSPRPASSGICGQPTDNGPIDLAFLASLTPIGLLLFGNRRFPLPDGRHSLGLRALILWLTVFKVGRIFKRSN